MRERRKLTLRELATLADTDHAYIHRVEKCEKEPSCEWIERLLRILKPDRLEMDRLERAGYWVER